MAQDDSDLPPGAWAEDTELARAPRGTSIAKRVAAGLGIAGLAGLGIAWLGRDRLADTLITRQLVTLGLPATYDIVSIGPRQEVLANIVVGDRAHPDLTIARAEITLAPRFGLPAVARVRLVSPRLSGSYMDGKLSLGSLDKLLFGATGTVPFRLPDVALSVSDGRALLRTDLGGPVALRLAGAGNLRDGFAGAVALAAPVLAAQGCRAERAMIYGRLSVRDARPRFVGPARARTLVCADAGIRIASPEVGADLVFDQPLDGARGSLTLRTDRLAAGTARADLAGGDATLTWRKRALTARYRLALTRASAPPGTARALALDGMVRTAGGERVNGEGTLTGAGLAPGPAIDAALAAYQRAAAGSLASPLLARLRGALSREMPGSMLVARFAFRREPGMLSLVVPEGRLTGARRAPLLVLSRMGMVVGDEGPARLSGAFITGGEGVPAISGRAVRAGARPLAVELTMQPYRAGDAAFAIPRLRIVAARGGGVSFAGTAQVDGPLPGGGATRGLVVPVDGALAPGSGLALWRRCANLRFERLRLADLALDARALTLCPPPGGAIVRADAARTRIAAGAPGLALTGRLGATPIRIASGPVGLAMPGLLTARALDVALGPVATASRFHVATLDARVGRTIAGRFAGAEVRLAAAPLDLVEARGDWRYADGRLAIAGASFRLLDRAAPARFAPLVARDATLILADNAIVADAVLRAPASDRAVVRARIVHDLSHGTGHADLAVDTLSFDKALQPDTLTPLALGVVANAAGAVRGRGRIDWNAATVTSSGTFGSDGLDFAAAFGPVKGAAGTIVFTDLLGLVTAPAQQLKLASINPGIEVDDGVLGFALRPGLVLAVEGARWPFMGGTLRLEPVTMTLGAAERRRYTLAIDGLDAALFVARVDLGNLNASGIFDGALPLVFEAGGSGRIEDGHLASRPPGGNVSYVGALTYKDLSAMANFAFDALKSLDFTHMDVGMEGPLDGEIVTRLRFTGVRQGAGAKRNFLTERIARLPLQFNVNLRAPFFQLVTSFKSLYDPAYVRDPRALGLIGADGKPVPPSPSSPPSPRAPPPRVQPPASGPMR